MAMRFALGLKGVATGIPVSFLDILDTVIEESGEDRPNTEEEAAALRQIAATCESVFRREEEAVALHRPLHGPPYPDSPHDGCCGQV